MTIFKFSMQAVKGGSAIKQHLFSAPWREFFTTGITPPEKSTHVVKLVYDGKSEEQEILSINTLQFENTILKFETDDANQHLYVDIGILNEPLFSKNFKFVGVSCDSGQENMIEHCQCIGANDERTDLALNTQYAIDTPMHVITKFRMPPEKEIFSFFLLIDDLLDGRKDFFHKVDPGVGNGPPKV